MANFNMADYYRHLQAEEQQVQIQKNLVNSLTADAVSYWRDWSHKQELDEFFSPCSGTVLSEDSIPGTGIIKDLSGSISCYPY